MTVKGPFKGRGYALRGLTSAGLQVSHLQDLTPIHTNGVRARKARRL